MANKIHPTALLTGDIELGDHNEIGPYCVLEGPLRIGNGNLITSHVVIGSPGQDTRNPRYDSSQARIEIGDDNIIREFTAIQKPCYRDVTRLGNRVFLMQSVHVPHDAILYDDVVVTPMVVMGGIVRILPGANLAVGCSLHQYTVIGDYSIVAMGATATKNVLPFSRYIPNEKNSVNEYAVKKHGFSDQAEEIAAYVLEGQRPTTPRLVEIVDRFDALCVESKRKTYWR